MGKIIFVTSLHISELTIPIGVLSLASILDQENYEVEIHDLNYLYQNKQLAKHEDDNRNFNEIAKYLLDQDAEILGFSCMSNNYHTYLKVAEIVKSNSNSKVFLGGPQASLTAKETLLEYDFIDLVCIGESETSILSVINYLFGKCNSENLKGVAIRENDQVIIKKEPELIKDLSELPKLNYDLIPFYKDLEAINIEVGRGCPFTCTFCSTQEFWKRNFRLKSIDDILEEILFFTVNHNKKRFALDHDLFTVNKGKVIEFCNRLMEEQIDIEWSCSARIDTVDEELLLKMNQAGCTRIFFGVETGSDRMQKILKKNLKVTFIKEQLAIIKSIGFTEIVFSFIYGFPQETLEDLRQTFDLISYIYLNQVGIVQLNTLEFLAGTELFNEFKSDLVFNKNYTFDIENMNTTGAIDLLKNNLEIFPHYYKSCEEKPYHYHGLDKICMMLFNTYSRCLRKSITLVMKSFNYKLFEMIEDIALSKASIAQKMTGTHEYFYSDIDNYMYHISNIDLIGHYIEHNHFGDMDSLIKQTFRFEREKVRIALVEEVGYESKFNFKYDILNFNGTKDEILSSLDNEITIVKKEYSQITMRMRAV